MLVVVLAALLMNTLSGCVGEWFVIRTVEEIKRSDARAEYASPQIPRYRHWLHDANPLQSHELKRESSVCGGDLSDIRNHTVDYAQNRAESGNKNVWWRRRTVIPYREFSS